MEIKLDKDSYKWKKLSKERIDAIIVDIAAGSPNKHAAICNGVSDVIFYQWLQQGELELAHDKESLCTYLVSRLRATEKDEIQLCRQLIKHSEKGHRGAEWTLERCYWKQFGVNAADIEFNQRMEKLEQKSGIKSNKIESFCDEEQDVLIKNIKDN